MCEKRTRKIKKGSHITRLREARRIQRLQLIASPVTTSDESNSSPPIIPQQPLIDKVAQNRVILELAWKTIALMHKNKLIQQKIIALQKETKEFVASVMNNPENRLQHEQRRLYVVEQGQVPMQGTIENNMALKVEPKLEII